ncbi:MAG: efflux RND transporter periplasmic adaptor subunit [Bacteroidales bacterium]|nr:efflux RND transporter periplasmic adaptor subunit [Bacteroidales bacterium]
MKKITIIIAVLLISVAIVFTLIRNKKSIDDKNIIIDRSKNAVAVTIRKATLLPLQSYLSVPSVLAAKEEAVISANAQGKISVLYFDIGSKVSKGQVIGRIDCEQKQISLQAIELTIEKLKQDYARFQDLFKGNAINETTVLDARYNYENTLLQAQQIKLQIEDANIIAPISGIITSRRLVAGEFATMGMILGTIVNPAKLKTSVFVNEKNILNLNINDEAVITSDVFPAKTFRSTVTYISPKGDENHNYQVDLLVNDKDNLLKAGTYIKVRFDLNTKATVLQIPKKALVDGVKNPYVYVIEGNTAKQIKLVLGREFNENIEVLEGISAGNSVVIDGQINLMDGSLIEITN